MELLDIHVLLEKYFADGFTMEENKQLNPVLYFLM